MTREQKLALVLGFAAVLVVGLLISDHLAAARSAQLEDAPHDATVVVDASEGEALRRVVTLPGTEEIFHGRPARRMADASPVAPDPAPISESRELADPSTEAGRAREPIRLVLGGGGGVYDPSERGGTVLDRVGESVAGGAEAIASHVRKLTDLVTMAKPNGMAEMGETRAEVVSREVDTSPVVLQHQVRANESLYKIAAQYYGDGNKWRLIARANEGRVGEDGSVREGVTLRIVDPTTGATPERAATPAPIVHTSGRPETQPKGPMTYTVKAGDTLGEISQALLGTVRRQHELIALNRDVLRDPDNLRAGTVLKLPSS